MSSDDVKEKIHPLVVVWIVVVILKHGQDGKGQDGHAYACAHMHINVCFCVCVCVCVFVSPSLLISKFQPYVIKYRDQDGAYRPMICCGARLGHRSAIPSMACPHPGVDLLGGGVSN